MIAGAPNCWVLIVPGVFAAPVLIRLRANCCSLVRSTSANFTCSRICCSCTGATVQRIHDPGGISAGHFSQLVRNLRVGDSSGKNQMRAIGLNIDLLPRKSLFNRGPQIVKCLRRR